MVHHVKDRTLYGQPLLLFQDAGKRNAGQDKADLRNRRTGQNMLDINGEQRDESAGQHRKNRNQQKHFSEQFIADENPAGKDQNTAVFTYVSALAQANEVPALVRLQGLDPMKTYRVEETGETYGGDELMQSGLLCRTDRGDAASLLYTLRAIQA